MAMKRFTVLLKDKDEQAVKAIQARFHLRSQNEAIRFALRALALSPEGKGALQELGLQGVQSPPGPPSVRAKLTASTARRGTIAQDPVKKQTTRSAKPHNSQQHKVLIAQPTPSDA